jgi:tRNA U55 pseudouridine synthase TruB
VSVTAHAIEVIGAADDTVTLRVRCSAGFYIRSLAHDLGARLGVGAHLVALCRTSSGELTLAQAVALSALEAGPDGVAAAHRAIIPIADMLPALPACLLTSEGLRRALHGQDLGPADFTAGFTSGTGSVQVGRHSISGHFRLVGPDGSLVGVAAPSSKPALLHPAVVLV